MKKTITTNGIHIAHYQKVIANIGTKKTPVRKKINQKKEIEKKENRANYWEDTEKTQPFSIEAPPLQNDERKIVQNIDH